jgi:hypothetical protein
MKDSHVFFSVSSRYLHWISEWDKVIDIEGVYIMRTRKLRIEMFLDIILDFGVVMGP